ncbi:MAG: L-threonylcarbamoyladenylate synthase, partial [Pseudomonadota bacterium]|nr:L-threonylcarbamoyladenylate synthase [Pseudomonadota bacterium]
MARIRSTTNASIAEAAALLRAGELVSLPTETVYGLGANALDDTAVAKIYAAKNRPSFNPLIVHVPDVATARQYAQFNDLAERVAETLWPGPLSIVLPRTEASALSKLVSAGLDTVAVRIPASPHARRLFAVAKLPVAAPSANKSNRLSPTEARHVANNFGEEVSLVLDGGPCTVGLESTVLDLSTDTPTLLRAGGTAQDALEAVIGRPLARAGTDDHSPKSPGMLSRHYAPRTPLRINATQAEDGGALLGFGAIDGTLNLSPSGDAT